MGIKDLFSLPVSLIVERSSARYPAGNGSADGDAVKARLLDYLTDTIDGAISSYEFSTTSENGLVYIILTATCNENIAVLSDSA